MMYAYDPCYISGVQDMVGNMLDYAVYTLQLKLKEFWGMFLKSTISRKIALGDAACLAGNSGVELAWKVLDENIPDGDFPNRDIKPEPRFGRSKEYWTGWSLAYYQWQSGTGFQQIEQEISILYVVDMYEKYHEMDIERFCEEITRIRQAGRMCAYVKYYRKRIGISQREAAKEAGIPLRTLQQYEQEQKNINKASADTVIRLARVYGVRPEELL